MARDSSTAAAAAAELIVPNVRMARDSSTAAGAAELTDSPARAHPFLALAMVVSPYLFDRRDLVRRTMLQDRPIRASTTVFRFLIGSDIRHKAAPGNAAALTAAQARLDAELREHAGDMLVLDALDGRGVDNQCACTEKTLAWLQYALRAWPTAWNGWASSLSGTCGRGDCGKSSAEDTALAS